MNTVQTYGTLFSFDAREMRLDFENNWDQCREEAFLLKSDIVKPLSVDDAVWEKIVEVAEQQSEVASALKRAMPQWIGPHINLWSNLSELSAFCVKASSLLPKPYWMIAITIMEDTDLLNYLRSRDDFHSLIHLHEAVPAEIDDRWDFLGFDVADAARTSGLTNCFYYEAEEIYAKQTFASSLNQYHLFADAASAGKFRHYTNQRVKEHAPFFIYGLFKVSCNE